MTKTSREREMVAYYTELEDEKKRVKARDKMLRDYRAKVKARKESVDSWEVTGDTPGEPVSSRSSSRTSSRGTAVVMELGATGSKCGPVTVGTELAVDMREVAVGLTAEGQSGE